MGKDGTTAARPVRAGGGVFRKEGAAPVATRVESGVSLGLSWGLCASRRLVAAGQDLQPNRPAARKADPPRQCLAEVGGVAAAVRTPVVDAGDGGAAGVGIHDAYPRSK